MKAVLRETGLSADQLRVWERRYGAVRPARTPTGRRVYREEEVQRLKLLAALVNKGHAIGKIAALSDKDLLRRIGNSKEAPLGRKSELVELIDILANFDLQKIGKKLGLLRYAVSPREFAFEIVPQVMMLVGKKIDAGSFSVAQEHALSEILQGHLKRIYEDLSALDGAREPEKTLLFCTRDGDSHDFGLRMAAIACRAAGLKTHYFGKSLPIDALADACVRLKPQAVVLGLATLPAKEEKIAPQAFVNGVHAQIDERIEFWIGGPAARSIKKPKGDRSSFIFETIRDLEEMLKMGDSRGPLSHEGA